MRCTIGTTNLREFNRAINSLSKIGEELYLEPREGGGLSLRTVTPSRSAYFTYEFTHAFFTHFDHARTDETRCRVPMRAMLHTLRTSSDRLVQKCKIALNYEDAKIIIETSRHGITKTHTLAFIECDALQAVYESEGAANRVIFEPKVMSDAIAIFQANVVEEVTFKFGARNLVLKSHTDEQDAGKVHTMVTLASREFAEYVIREETELTVCLKEVRSLVSFIMNTNLQTTLTFTTPGDPMVFCFASKPLYEGVLVLATLGIKHDAHTNAHKNSNDAKHENSCEDLEMSRAHTDANAHDPSSQPDDQTAHTDYYSSQEDAHDSQRAHSQTHTPPSKRSRFYFRRCFESTFNPDCLPGHDVILAEDSDQD